MLTLKPNIDLAILAPQFIECGDYTKEVILEELEYYQTMPDFLCIVSRNDTGIDGFLIGYRQRNSLWLAQVWSVAGWAVKVKTLSMAKEWALERGMTTITAETKRSEMKAMRRYGFKEFSVIMKVQL